MGGHLTFLFRLPDGSLRTIEGHTAEIKPLVFSLGFLEKKPEFFEAFFAEHVNEVLDEKTPSGYGILIFDLQRDWIGGLQGYTTLVGTAGTGKDPNFAELAAAGRFQRVTFFEGGGEKESTTFPLEDGTFRLGHQWYFDLSPFKVEEFPESGDGYRDLLHRLKERGFSFTKDEEAAWYRRADEPWG